jgi:general L-amino acid transport system permease protein
MGVTAPRPVTQRPQRGLYDRHVQAILWQLVIAGLVLLAIAFLVSNTLTNLETRDIKTGFDFLAREAGFEIGETLIAYSPAASYARALLTGFLNTVQVAVIGCVLATVLGILIGIGTLSTNWLTARLTAGYIHLLRNIPVLLQIILWYTVLISERFLPHPRQAGSFLGIFATQRGIYLPIPEAHVGWSAALIVAALACIAALVVSRRASTVRERTGNQPAWLLNTLIALAAAPVLAWLVAGAPIGMSWPALRGFNIAGGARITPEFAAILIGLTVYTSAFIAEIVRSGLLAVPKGQIEAARALGLKESVILRKVTLPQALRIIVPPLTSQYLNLTKNSSLSVAVGYPDLVNVANTTINQTGQAIEGITIIMLVYLTTSLSTSAFMNWYNRRIALAER